MGVITEIRKGMRVTGATMWRTITGQEMVTTEYPKEMREKPQRFHGRHVLNRYPDGMEKCIGCELCAGVCPADCIHVRGADNDPVDPTSPGERFGRPAKTFTETTSCKIVPACSPANCNAA